MVKNWPLVLLVVALMGSVVLIGGCAGLIPEGSEEGGFDWSVIVILVVIAAVFYFLMIRPQQKKQKQHQDLVGQLQKGDRVVTAGGIFGEVESLSDDSVVIKVESGTTLRIDRRSIALKRER